MSSLQQTGEISSWLQEKTPCSAVLLYWLQEKIPWKSKRLCWSSLQQTGEISSWLQEKFHAVAFYFSPVSRSGFPVPLFSGLPIYHASAIFNPSYLPAMIPDFSDFHPNIDADMMVVFNFCLAFLMFGIALDMRVSDFKRVAEFPKSVLVGLASQWLILPILTVYLIHIWNPISSIALGLLLVATCPGGNISNYATHLSKGNAALSVTLTAFVSVSSIVATPFMFALFSLFVPQVEPLLREINLNPWSILMLLVQLVLVPMILGMLFNYFFPNLTSKIKKLISRLSLLIFLGFIIAALFGDIDAIIRYAKYVFFLVVVHNLIALAAGYFWAKWNKLPESDSRAVSMETGIQNSGLGLLLIFAFFPNLPGMMLVTAVWAVWDMVSSFLLAVYWSRKPLHP